MVKELRKLTADNPNQQKRIDAIEPIVAAKLTELKQTVDLRRSGSLEETNKIIRAGEGKRFMDDLRRILSAMEDEERELLKQRALAGDSRRQHGEIGHHLRYVACLALRHSRGILYYPFFVPPNRQFRQSNPEFLD